MTARFRIEPLGEHDRKSFTCAVPALDRYLVQQATQDIRRRISNCFVACNDAGSIAAYYTFASSSLPLTELTADQSKRLPRYGVVPAALIGRLAVDKQYQGRGLGGILVLDAVQRAARSDSAIFALIVDAKDEAAIGFYRHLGFQRFASRPMSLLLPIATAVQAISSAG